MTNSGDNDKIRISGAIGGALNPDSERADKHAEQYYEAVRKMQTDVKRIAENIGYSEESIQSIKDFIFNEELVSIVAVIRIDVSEYTAKKRPIPEKTEVRMYGRQQACLL